MVEQTISLEDYRFPALATLIRNGRSGDNVGAICFFREMLTTGGAGDRRQAEYELDLISDMEASGVQYLIFE